MSSSAMTLITFICRVFCHLDKKVSKLMPKILVSFAMNEFDKQMCSNLHAVTT